MVSTCEDPTERPAVLLVDDHPPNLIALEAVLAPLEYRLVRATSGAEALRKAAEQDLVLIVMDVHMPGLDGYKTVEILRHQERVKDVPIVFLTAVQKVDEHVRRGYALGAVDYVTKPFDPVVLRAKVAALVSLYVRGRRAERAHREELDRLKDLFLGAVGHDLRNPLSTIVLGAGLLDSDTLSEQNRRHQARRIARAAARMDRMVGDILELTQAKFSGGWKLQRERTDLASVCRDAIAEIRAIYPSRVVECQVSCDAHGDWDPKLLTRVVSNLVSNAVQHTSEGAVRVSVTGEGDLVSVTVHNEGRAIQSDSVPQLFEPFQRGGSSAHGVGLGLYIVREIVRAHGGTVNVRSTEADGTDFTAQLPRTLAAATPR